MAQFLKIIIKTYNVFIIHNWKVKDSCRASKTKVSWGDEMGFYNEMKN